MAEFTARPDFANLDPIAKHLILKMLFSSFAQARTRSEVGFLPPSRIQEGFQKTQNFAPALEQGPSELDFSGG